MCYNNAVSYTHLDVYKRQDFHLLPVSEIRTVPRCGQPYGNTLPVRKDLKIRYVKDLLTPKLDFSYDPAPDALCIQAVAAGHAIHMYEIRIIDAQSDRMRSRAYPPGQPIDMGCAKRYNLPVDFLPVNPQLGSDIDVYKRQVYSCSASLSISTISVKRLNLRLIISF